MRLGISNFGSEQISFFFFKVACVVAWLLLNANNVGASPISIATIFDCTSVVAEFENGAKPEKNYKARFIEIDKFNDPKEPNRTELYVLGPTRVEAQSGTAFRVNSVSIWPEKTRKDILRRAIAENIEFGWILREDQPNFSGVGFRIYFAAPVNWLVFWRRGLSVTEFECQQALH